MPKDAREKDVLERLMAIRDSLLLLKMDRTKYIRTQDVMLLYDQLIDQVKQLNEIRKDQDQTENRGWWNQGVRRLEELTRLCSGQGSGELFSAYLALLHDDRSDK